MQPFSEACEENKRVILDVIAPYLADAQTLLEIGSGTGQHAVYFAQHLPQLTWQTSDVITNHTGINAWIATSSLHNVLAPITLDVLKDAWPQQHYDAVFSANTTHIMSWQAVEAMFVGISQVLKPHGIFCLYGPFNIDGQYTAESNARFDAFLRQRDPCSGIRDRTELIRLGMNHRLEFVRTVDMPVNNLILVWKKI